MSIGRVKVRGSVMVRLKLDKGGDIHQPAELHRVRVRLDSTS